MLKPGTLLASKKGFNDDRVFLVLSVGTDCAKVLVLKSTIEPAGTVSLWWWEHLRDRFVEL